MALRIDHHVFIHFDAGQLAGIEASLLNLTQLVTKGNTDMSAALDRLTQEVAETKGAADSAIALLTGLGDYIRANVSDQAALNALADDLDAKQAEIAAAVAANPVPTAP